MTTMTNGVVDARAVNVASLQAREDQAATWVAHAAPMRFAEAAELVRAAQRADGEASDVAAVDLRTWAFGSSDGRTMQLLRVPLAGREVGRVLSLRELGFAQLCQRIGVPAPYIKALPPKLQIANMNWGLAQQRQGALLRLAGDEVRAVTSERYAALDNDVLLDVVTDVLQRTGYQDDARVRATATGPHTLMRITVPNEGVVVKRDDVIEWGIDIGNSELGLRSVQVTPVTYRLVCTNGMRAWRSESALRMRHIGDPDRLREHLRDAVPVAFAEARGDIARWQRSVDVLIDNALDEVEGLRGFGLSTGEVQAIGRELAVDTKQLPASSTVEVISNALKTTTTAFDVANAITAVARGRSDTAARLTLEEVGHRYLSRATA